MSNRNRRAFEDLTWPQCCVVRDVATVKRAGFSGSFARAARGLLGKRMPPIEIRGSRFRLTDVGREQWKRMREWRPDLYDHTK